MTVFLRLEQLCLEHLAAWSLVTHHFLLLTRVYQALRAVRSREPGAQCGPALEFQFLLPSVPYLPGDHCGSLSLCFPVIINDVLLTHKKVH